jgi:CheY-like chemotaxis protein
MNLDGPDILDVLDIYALTKAGTGELTRGSTHLSATALQLLVLFDGQLAVAAVARLAKEVSAREFQETVLMLAKRGYIELKNSGKDTDLDFTGFLSAKPAAPVSKVVLEQADAEADHAAESLRYNGYYVSIARRAEQKKSPASGTQYSVLVIEDSLEFQKVLKFLLDFEHFQSRAATNRSEIVAALRTLPSPDVILLDVNLPDINGFDVLARIRQHPILKSIPVIMVTGQTTRQDVLHGLAGGADGYITKPFDYDILLTGIRAVLGIR